VVAAITPASGPSSGGTPVTITGSNFRAGATAAIGGIACTAGLTVAASEIRCTTPAGMAAGPPKLDVHVVNSDLTEGTRALAFMAQGLHCPSPPAFLPLPLLLPARSPLAGKGRPTKEMGSAWAMGAAVTW